MARHLKVRGFGGVYCCLTIKLRTTLDCRLLVKLGLQEKRDGLWCPTEAGRAFSVLLQVRKKQLAGTDVQQLKWKESVLGQLVDLA